MTQGTENGTIYVAELAVCSDAESLECYRVDHKA